MINKPILESRIKKFVKDRLNYIGAYHHWPVQNGMGTPCLDCHGCWRGKYFSIETKAPGKKMTMRQEATAQKIRDAGGIVMVIDNEADARNLFAWSSK